MGVFSCLKSIIRLAIEAFVVILLVTFIPGLPPDVNFSESWKVDKVTLEGKLSPNNRLDGIEYLYKGRMYGPESLTDDDGFIYTSLYVGDIVKVSSEHVVPVVKFGKPCKGVYQEEICGRPLGITFDKDGHLYAADAYYGIFKVNIKTGDREKLVSFTQQIEGRKPKIPNSLAVACNGDIYWTDSDTNFSLQDAVFSFLGDGTGRLIHYDIRTRKNKVLLDNLHFANGVRLSQNEDYLLVSETNKNRIHRVYIKGPKMGTSDIFTDKLPGMPDNIQTDGSSGFIVAIVQDVHSKNPSMTQVFSQFPNIRKFLARCLGLIQLAFKTINRIYPNEFSQKGVHFIGHLEPVTTSISGKTAVLHLSENGEILDCLWGDSKVVGRFSEASIIKDQLYLASPFNKYLGRISLSKIGWQHLKQKSDSLSATKQRCSTINKKEPTQLPVENEFKVPNIDTKTPTITRTTTKPSTTTTPKPSTTRSTTSKPKPISTTEIPPKPDATKPISSTVNPSATTPDHKTTTKPTTTTPKPSATTSKHTTTTPKPTTSTPKPIAATPKPTAATPKSIPSAPSPTQKHDNIPKKKVVTPDTTGATAQSISNTAKRIDPTPNTQHDQIKSTSDEELRKVPTRQKLPKSQEDSKSTNSQNKVKSDSKEPKIKSTRNEL